MPQIIYYGMCTVHIITMCLLLMLQQNAFCVEGADLFEAQIMYSIRGMRRIYMDSMMSIVRITNALCTFRNTAHVKSVTQFFNI